MPYYGTKPNTYLIVLIPRFKIYRLDNAVLNFTPFRGPKVLRFISTYLNHIYKALVVGRAIIVLILFRFIQASIIVI